MQNLPRQPPQSAAILLLNVLIEVKKRVVNQIENSLTNIPDGGIRDKMINLLIAEESNLNWLIYLETLLAQLDLNHNIHNN
jgi:hypothetical protein